MFVVVIAGEIPASALASIGLKHLHSKWKGHFRSRSKSKEQRYSKLVSQGCWGFFSVLYKNAFSKPGFSKRENVWCGLVKLSVSAEWRTQRAHVKPHEEAASELLTSVSEWKPWHSATCKLGRNMQMHSLRKAEPKRWLYLFEGGMSWG